MRIYIFLVILFLIKFSFSQTSHAQKNVIQIGEQTEISYELILNPDEGRVSYIPYSKIISCYKKYKNGSIDSTSKVDIEIVKNFKDSMAYLNQNELKWIGTYTVTAWDTGVFVIPPIKISTQKNVYEFNAITLKIIAPRVDPSKDMYDIKEQFLDIEDDAKSWLRKNWIFFTFCLLMCVIIYVLLRKYLSKKRQEKPEIILSLRERTLLKIKQLEDEKLWEAEKFKDHFIEFSFLIRIYLSEKYHLNLLEKTSYESILLLKQKEIHPDLLTEIQSLLNYADMIKFAKSQASSQDAILQLNKFKNIVEHSEVKHVL